MAMMSLQQGKSRIGFHSGENAQFFLAICSFVLLVLDCTDTFLYGCLFVGTNFERQRFKRPVVFCSQHPPMKRLTSSASPVKNKHLKMQRCFGVFIKTEKTCPKNKRHRKTRNAWPCNEPEVASGARDAAHCELRSCHSVAQRRIEVQKFLDIF